MRLRRKIGLGVLVVLAGLLLWPVATHYRAKARLAKYKRQLVADGERLTVKELAFVPPAEAVAALHRLTILTSALGNAPTSAPPAMVQVTNGSAIATWPCPVYPSEEISNAWPLLEQEFSGKDEKLAELREVLRADRLMALHDYSQGFNMLYPHLPELKRAAQWLNAAVIRDLHDGAGNDAAENLRALSSLSRIYDREAMLIGVLVRLALGAIGANACWAALQSSDLTGDQWKEIQASWERTDILPHAELALEMERVLGGDVLERGRESYASIGQAFGARSGASAMSDLQELTSKALEQPLDSWREFSHRFPGYWQWKLWGSYEDEIVNLRATQAGIDAIREARQASSAAVLLRVPGELDRIGLDHPRAGEWLGMSLGLDGSLKPFSAKLVDFETQRRLLIVAIAVKRYQLSHGAVPGSLEQLSPGFLTNAVTDLDGQPLRYRKTGEQSWQLYSVGTDLKDDGGDTTPPEEAGANARRWWRWKDAVWPQPAGEEQVRRYIERNRQRWQEKQSGALVPPGLLDEAQQRLFRQRYGLGP